MVEARHRVADEPGRDVPLLIYCPGIGVGSRNTADGVAEVIAAVIDRHSQGTFHATPTVGLSAPRGLVVGKSVVEDQSQTPVLHVFELDYRRRLIAATGKATPPVSPGAVQSSMYAVVGLMVLLGALVRPAKGAMAKLQLLLGLVAVSALVLAAVVSVVTWLTAAGLFDSRWLDGVLGLDPSQAALATSAVTIVLWTAARRRLLAIATTVQRLMRYMSEPRHQATVAQTIDDALDGLQDNGWTGPVHLLAYSFGSLVAVDSLFPPQSGLRPNERVRLAVATLTTIGCPVDIVRLFRPKYFADRPSARIAGSCTWTYVYNAKDLFASSFADHGDTPGTGKPIELGGRQPRSLPYGSQRLGVLDLLAVRGFSAHDGYWGGWDEASCFDDLVDQWRPAPTSTPPAQLSRAPSAESGSQES
jgi:hypothetical protein